MNSKYAICRIAFNLCTPCKNCKHLVTINARYHTSGRKVDQIINLVQLNNSASTYRRLLFPSLHDAMPSSSCCYSMQKSDSTETFIANNNNNQFKKEKADAQTSMPSFSDSDLKIPEAPNPDLCCMSGCDNCVS